MSTTTTLGSSPLSTAHHDDDRGNPLFVATPRHADERRDPDAARLAVAECALWYRRELRDLAQSLPAGTLHRGALEALLYAVDHVEEVGR